ncbi:MAG: hypothetical protein U9Q05_13625, partial [Thermodesulfobacteriota bacterium]|nr:hypothetical protein [Thermodesulfobacteriota bacterium]
LAVPASIGMFFNTMFNVVDTYFSGLISTEAIAALSLSFPVFFTHWLIFWEWALSGFGGEFFWLPGRLQFSLCSMSNPR